MPFCNHCSRQVNGVGFEEGGPCPGCAGLGHTGSAWNCPACGQDPGPDEAKAKAKPPRTPKLNRLRKQMKGKPAKKGIKPRIKQDEKRKSAPQPPARAKFAALTDSLRKINHREFEACSVAELREFHSALIEAATVAHHAILDRFQRT